MGFTYWNGSKLSKWQSIIVSAGGPIFSLLIGLSLIFISGVVNYNLLKKLISFWRTIIYGNSYVQHLIIYPKWWSGYGGYHSDGYSIMSIIKNEEF